MERPSFVSDEQEKVVIVNVPEGWTVSVMAMDSGIGLEVGSVKPKCKPYTSLVEVKAERQTRAPRLEDYDSEEAS